jgi:hypothetical protein
MADRLALRFTADRTHSRSGGHRGASAEVAENEEELESLQADGYTLVQRHHQ